ncbi:MAG: helix-turn-helix domain-containing protein, partial [Proteobacteria bacterium]|nr:helix-turn-helix domain-containing protein [Pseudomonadota bacterium]
SHYLHLHCVGASVALLVQRAEAIITFTTDLHDLVGTEQTLEVGTVDIFMFMRLICGRAWLPSAVHYAHPAPPNIAPYTALFRAPVHFNREITSMHFPASWLERPVLNANPDLHRILRSYVENLEQQYSGNFPGKIRRVVRTLLSTGKCTADRLAVLLSMHRRTLHRHLVANGTTFKEIVDEERNEIAVRNLAATDMSINKLAAMLGYRDTSSFIRAFRRWSGVVPTEWRAQHRS